MAYRLVIGCNMDQYKTLGGNFTPNRYLVLDNIKEKTVNSSSKIATQPLQSGDTMSDHMYREPTTYNVSGTFSLNGKNWKDDSYDFIQVGDRLTNVEEVFEKIKDNGILCRLVTLDVDDNNSNLKNIDTQTGNVVNQNTRFKIRKNMALQNVTWVENYNSVNFTFSFHQVIMVEKQEYEELTEDKRKELGLPYVTSPSGSSLGTVLQETGQLHQSVVQMLADNGYMKTDFLQGLAVSAQVLAGSIITLALANAILVVVAIAIKIGTMLATAALTAAIGTGATVVAATSSVVPVGTIVAAAVAVVAVIAIGIATIIKKVKEKQKEYLAFKIINGSVEPDAIRLNDLMERIEHEVNKVVSNITVYNIKSDKPQQVILNMGGDYYSIEFIQNNTTENYGWEAKVTNLDGSPVTNMCHEWSVVSSFMDMNRRLNCWFRDNNKEYEVYLMNPAFSADYNPGEESLENVRKKLSSYTIFVSKGDIEANIKIIEDALLEAIQSEGFLIQ